MPEPVTQYVRCPQCSGPVPVQSPRWRRRKYDYRLVHHLVDLGMTYAQVARELGTSAKYIGRLMGEYPIDRPPRIAIGIVRLLKRSPMSRLAALGRLEGRVRTRAPVYHVAFTRAWWSLRRRGVIEPVKAGDTNGPHRVVEGARHLSR